MGRASPMKSVTVDGLLGQITTALRCRSTTLAQYHWQYAAVKWPGFLLFRDFDLKTTNKPMCSCCCYHDPEYFDGSVPEKESIEEYFHFCLSFLFPWCCIWTLHSWVAKSQGLHSMGSPVFYAPLLWIRILLEFQATLCILLQHFVTRTTQSSLNETTLALPETRTGWGQQAQIRTTLVYTRVQRSLRIRVVWFSRWW